jgi:dnd system-associated protein 4
MVSTIDRLYVDEKGDKKIYDMLKSDEPFFKNYTGNKELFLFAMALGFKNQKPLPFSGKRLGYFLEKDLKYEDYVLLNAIAINETKSLDILTDKEKIFKIAEEYAHGGLTILHKEIGPGKFGSFSKNFELKLDQLLEK